MDNAVPHFFRIYLTDYLSFTFRKKWVDRKETVEKTMKERQDKRTKNIKARKDDKLKSKMKKLKKKGRIIPGF